MLYKYIYCLPACHYCWLITYSVLQIEYVINNGDCKYIHIYMVWTCSVLRLARLVLVSICMSRPRVDFDVSSSCWFARLVLVSICTSRPSVDLTCRPRVDLFVSSWCRFSRLFLVSMRTCRPRVDLHVSSSCLFARLVLVPICTCRPHVALHLSS